MPLETETRNMEMAKIKQISLVLCCMLSLFVSNVSACYCAHNQTAQQKELHCGTPQESTHQESAENHSADDLHSPAASGESHHEASSETGIESVDRPDGCCCIQPAPKTYAKTEGITIQKQNAGLLTVAPVAIQLVSGITPVKTIQFVAPFYLSDSFYNLTPGRAPPVL